MYFSELHALYIDGFMEIAYATLLTMQEGQKSPFGETISYIIAIFSIIVICIHFPYSYLLITTHSKEILLHDKEFKKTYGQLIDNIKVDTLMQRLFFVFYLLRRIVLIALAHYCKEMPLVFQISILLLISLLTSSYYLSSEPHIRSRDRKIEVANEFMIAIIIYTIMTQSEWVTIPE